jgi:glycerophosphoryl diester phosphodiesterase
MKSHSSFILLILFKYFDYNCTLEILTMKIIAHRGARGLAPENTIAAIKEGLKHHPDMIEIDVRVTKDGVCILNHDPKLQDGTTVASATFKQLLARKTDLTTLDKAIQTVNRKVPMYIEVKPRVPTKQIIKLLRSYLDKGWQPEDLWLASFSQKTLRELRQGLPELPVIVNAYFSGVWATWRAKRLGTKYFSLNHRVLWPRFVRSIAKRGWKLTAYTVNNPDEAEQLAKYGIYAITTDHPDRFISKSK